MTIVLQFNAAGLGERKTLTFAQMHPVFKFADARVLSTPQLTQHLQHRIDRVAHEHFESHKLIEERLEDPVEEFFRSLESAVVREV